MDLHLELAPGPKRPQIEALLRDAARSGRLRPGTRLPPSRALARDLGVSRGVVVEAYEQLVAEGWLVARRGAGTTVAHRGTTPVPVPRGGGGERGQAPFRLEGGPKALRAKVLAFEPFGMVGAVPYDLRTGRADLSAFPRAAWGRALAKALRELPDAELGYGDWRGHAPLRAALAAYLGRTRGVLAQPEHVVVCGGLAQGLTVVLRALARRGVRRVAIEDPGWRGQRRAAELAGVDWVPVPVDEHGLDVARLERLDVGAVAVTPAHQHPTGVVLAPERRTRLLAWARTAGALVIEDDYDAEYRYDRDPVGALQGLDPQHVVYAGSASKTLAPALRLGWLVVPPHLVEDVAHEKDLADRGTPVLEQAALAELLDSGELDRHIRRTRRAYRQRRDALVEALGPDVAVSGIAAGLHAVVPLAPGDDGAAAAAACLARGVRVDTLHRTCTAVAERPGALLLGYAAHPEAALRRAAGALREVLSGTA